MTTVADNSPIPSLSTQLIDLIASRRGKSVEQLAYKVLTDPEYKNKLRADPVAVLQALTTQELPSDFSVQIHESGSNVIHLVLPPPQEDVQKQFANTNDLTDEELERIAGGTDIVLLTLATSLVVTVVVSVLNSDEKW